MRSTMIPQDSPTLRDFTTQGSNRVATASARSLNFTKKTIDRLPSPTAMGLSAAKHVYFRDTRVPGLCLRVSSTGGKVFVFYRKIASRPERIVLGKYPDLTIEQARGMASKNNSVIATGGNPANSKREIRDEMTLKELFAQFGEYYGQQKRTWSEMQRQFNVYLHKWHLRRISSITKLDVVALHARLGRERGPYTANRTIELLCSIFNRAIEWGWSHENPAARIRANKEIKRERFLLPEELPQFFRALDAEPNKDIRDYIYLSLFTGGRRSNVAAMSWPQINFNRAVWSIPEDQVKAGEASRSNCCRKLWRYSSGESRRPPANGCSLERVPRDTWWNPRSAGVASLKLRGSQLRGLPRLRGSLARPEAPCDCTICGAPLVAGKRLGDRACLSSARAWGTLMARLPLRSMRGSTTPRCESRCRRPSGQCGSRARCGARGDSSGVTSSSAIVVPQPTGAARCINNLSTGVGREGVRVQTAQDFVPALAVSQHVLRMIRSISCWLLSTRRAARFFSGRWVFSASRPLKRSASPCFMPMTPPLSRRRGGTPGIPAGRARCKKSAYPPCEMAGYSASCISNSSTSGARVPVLRRLVSLAAARDVLVCPWSLADDSFPSRWPLNAARMAFML